MHVVVVESPAKAKTIGRYLGDGYRVFASYGHVSDLPAKDGSVRPEDGFAMTYVTARRANRVLSRIRAALKDAESLILATDPDREGEAIAWQVLSWLREKPDLFTGFLAYEPWLMARVVMRRRLAPASEVCRCWVEG